MLLIILLLFAGVIVTYVLQDQYPWLWWILFSMFAVAIIGVVVTRIRRIREEESHNANRGED